MKIIGIENSGANPMLLIESDEKEITFHKLPRGVLRVNPTDIKENVTLQPLDLMHYTSTDNAE